MATLSNHKGETLPFTIISVWWRDSYSDLEYPEPLQNVYPGQSASKLSDVERKGPDEEPDSGSVKLCPESLTNG